MRVRTVVLVVLALVVVGIAWSAVSFAGRGFSAREKPSWLEEVLARNARKLATPAGARELQNPVELTEEALRAAQSHWVDHCAICHSLEGSGDTAIGSNLYPPAPDMRDAHTQELSDGEPFYIINNGIRLSGMPAWGGQHSDEETWQLVSFIRQLPNLSEGEIRQLERLAGGEGGDHGGGEHQHGPGTEPHPH
jgi:mono/diheme cytochrome c family protein